MNIYKVIDILRQRKVIQSKIVLQKKFDIEGELIRLKAYVVTKGFEQKYSIDYTTTFASVVRYTILRALLVKAAVEDLEIDQMDVNTVFLNPELKEEIYIEIPEYFKLLYLNIDFIRKYLRLRKSIYRLK